MAEALKVAKSQARQSVRTNLGVCFPGGLSVAFLRVVLLNHECPVRSEKKQEKAADD